MTWPETVAGIVRLSKIRLGFEWFLHGLRFGSQESAYLRLNWLPSGYVKNSYWKWPFIMSFPIKNGDFP